MLVAKENNFGFINNSQQDEYEIVLKANKGDTIALEYIITKYKNFVKSKAKSYFPRRYDRTLQSYKRF